MEENKGTPDCPYCQSHEGLMDYVVVTLSKTIDRQEYKIKKLKEELVRLNNQHLGYDHENDEFSKENVGGTD